MISRLPILGDAWRLFFRWMCLMAAASALQADAQAAGDVRAFGAVGDGKADDTSAIRKAVEAGQGAVRFNKGIYRLTQTVVIELDKGFTSLLGDGTARVVMAGAGPAFRSSWGRTKVPLIRSNSKRTCGSGSARLRGRAGDRRRAFGSRRPEATARCNHRGPCDAASCVTAST